MKLVMYSGGYFEDNQLLGEEVLRLIEAKKPTITYIPSSFQDSDEEYEYFIEYFSSLGVKYFNIFHVDRSFSRKQLRQVLKADAVYLSGGNTFYFLMQLRNTGVLGALRQYLDRGGVLVGESAGSIIMTPDIMTASYPDFDADDNDVGLTNLDAMNLVNFDFFPHFDFENQAYIEELTRQSLTLARPIYAVPDGSGIVIEPQRQSFVGPYMAFIKGKSFIENES